MFEWQLFADNDVYSVLNFINSYDFNDLKRLLI